MLTFEYEYTGAAPTITGHAPDLTTKGTGPMYKRANSGIFIVLTTFGIVVVMAIFTWVMYGMAQQVYIMTDIMKDLSASMTTMVASQQKMAGDFAAVRVIMDEDMGAMATNLASVNDRMAAVSSYMQYMTNSVQMLSRDVGALNMNVSRASYAFSNPISYMFGNGMPF